MTALVPQATQFPCVAFLGGREVRAAAQQVSGCGQAWGWSAIIASWQAGANPAKAGRQSGTPAAPASPAACQMYCAGHRQVLFLLKYGLKEAALVEGQAVQVTPSVPT